MIRKTKNQTYSHFSHKRVYFSIGRFFGWKKIVSVFAILALVFVWSAIHPVQKVEAAGLDTVTTTLTDSEAVNTESRVQVVFTPSEAVVSNDTIVIYLGEATGGTEWEDDDADQTTADVACLQTDTTFDTPVFAVATATSPMYFGMSVNVVTGAGTTAITCTLGTGAADAPNNPGVAGIYPVAVVTTDDSGAGPAYVGDANDVTVSVTVLPNLSMLLDNADGTYCTGTPVVTCNLGAVLTTTVAEGNYDINVGTNGSGGATVSIAESGDLGTIPDCTEGDTIVAGTSDYGAAVAEDGAWTFQGDWADADPAECTPIEASEAFADTAAAIAIGGDDITVTHQAAVDSTIAAGTHSHTVTWTVVGDF